MRRDVARDLEDSAADFRRLVWPEIGPLCGGGRLVRVEDVAESGFKQDLDTLAGIDAWQLIDANGTMRGLASRVQWVASDCWKSFTIRKDRDGGGRTEYAKRLFALDHQEEGYLYPHLTVQAYLKNPRGNSAGLLSVAVARTEDVIRYCQAGLAKTRRTSNAEFFYVEWEDFFLRGLWIQGTAA